MSVQCRLVGEMRHENLSQIAIVRRFRENKGFSTLDIPLHTIITRAIADILNFNTHRECNSENDFFCVVF